MRYWIVLKKAKCKHDLEEYIIGTDYSILRYIPLIRHLPLNCEGFKTKKETKEILNKMINKKKFKIINTNRKTWYNKLFY